MDKESKEKIAELQNLEQQLQHYMMQKQAFQTEMLETENALEVLKESGDEVYKLVGQLLLKSDKKKTQEELGDKQKILQAII